MREQAEVSAQGPGKAQGGLWAENVFLNQWACRAQWAALLRVFVCVCVCVYWFPAHTPCAGRALAHPLCRCAAVQKGGPLGRGMSQSWVGWASLAKLAACAPCTSELGGLGWAGLSVCPCLRSVV